MMTTLTEQHIAHQLSVATSKIIPGMYRNWKGHLVLVVGVGMHSESVEPQVEYYEITDKFGVVVPDPVKWHRPFAYFIEYIEKDGYQGPRFAKVNERVHRMTRIYG